MSDTKTITIKVGLSIGFANASQYDELEIDVEGLGSEEEIEQACNEAATEWSSNYIDLYWSRKP